MDYASRGSSVRCTDRGRGGLTALRSNMKSNCLAREMTTQQENSLRWGHHDSVKQVHLEKKGEKQKLEATKKRTKMIQNTKKKHVENSCRYWNNEKEARAGISDLRRSFLFTFSPYGQVSRSVDGSYMTAPLYPPSHPPGSPKKQNKTKQKTKNKNTTAVPFKEPPCVRHVKKSELR